LVYHIEIMTEKKQKKKKSDAPWKRKATDKKRAARYPFFVPFRSATLRKKKQRRGNRHQPEHRRCSRLVNERGFAVHTQAFGLHPTLQPIPARRRRQRPTGGANVQPQPDRDRKRPNQTDSANAQTRRWGINPANQRERRTEERAYFSALLLRKSLHIG